MAATTQVMVWVVVDEDGDYVVGRTGDDAAALYDEEFGGDQGSMGLRRVKVTLTVPLPTPIKLAATVAVEESATVVAE